jgi:hypothetical protein
MDTEPFSDMQLGDGNCFLCGTPEPPITQEHVFPKWVQTRHDLWNQTLGLLNQTQIPYRSLRIPCCSICNQEDLSKLENRISSAVAEGYSGCLQLSPHDIYLWTGKLYFGVLRKEITLARERSKPNSEPILQPESLRHFSNLHMFLQAIRNKHEFSGRVPYSVLVCNLHDLGHPRNFCVRDNLFYMTLSIRLGEVGIIVAFEDAGLTERTYGRYVADVAGQKLHPIQFDELYAKVLYQVSLIQGGVSYVTHRNPNETERMRSLVLGGGRLRERSQEEYSRVLEPYVTEWIDPPAEHMQWFVPPNLVPTWMTDPAGQLLIRALGDWEASGTGGKKNA